MPGRNSTLGVLFVLMSVFPRSIRVLVWCGLALYLVAAVVPIKSLVLCFGEHGTIRLQSAAGHSGGHGACGHCEPVAPGAAHLACVSELLTDADSSGLFDGAELPGSSSSTACSLPAETCDDSDFCPDSHLQTSLDDEHSGPRIAGCHCFDLPLGLGHDGPQLRPTSTACVDALTLLAIASPPALGPDTVTSWADPAPIWPPPRWQGIASSLTPRQSPILRI